MGQVSASSLITASKQNLIDEVRSLLSFGIDVEHLNEQVPHPPSFFLFSPLSHLNEQRNSALHVACFAGHHLVAAPSPLQSPPSCSHYYLR